MVLFLTKGDNIFLNLHFIQVFNTLFLDKSIYALQQDDRDDIGIVKGIYRRNLTQNVILVIENGLSEIQNKNICMDMKYIDYLDGNRKIEFLNLLKKLFIRNNNSLILFNLNGTVFDILKECDLDLTEVYDSETKKFFAVFSESDLKNIPQLAQEAFEERLEMEIQNSCEDYDRESMSSRVKLTKYINMKNIMQDFSFFNYCIYQLALKLSENNVLDITKHDKNQDKTIFVHTMNSVVIGTILAQLFCIDLLLVDHLGPYNKLYTDDLSRSINRKRKYLVVCDVVCMGTELTTAKSIFDVLGIHYKGCITLVNIIPVGNISENIYSLYVINKDKNTIGYKISTDL